MIRVFLDANVYFAAFFSKKGASSLILEYIRKGKILLVADRIALREAERNLRLKTDTKTLKAFRRFLNQTPIQIVPHFSESVLSKYTGFIDSKDVPILAAAVETKADFLITLDRRDFLKPQVLSHSGKTKILTPGEFLKEQIRKGKSV